MESVVIVAETQTMYDLDVAIVDTFAVGDGAWVVHNCELQPYNGPGSGPDRGGHHIHAKAGFVDHPDYDRNAALALRNPDMADNSYSHQAMTASQQRMFRQLSRDVDDGTRYNTMVEHNRIAVQVLVDGGVPLDDARSYIAQSLWNLRSQGVTSPTNIPWDVQGGGYLRPGTFFKKIKPN